MKPRILAAALAAAALLGATPARAQTALADSAVGPRTQAISILPLHFLFGFYAGDYERQLTRTTTIGFGASYFSFGGWDDDYDEEPVYVDGEPYFDDSVDDADFDYTSVELKLRYYPSGDAMDGISFGVTAGPTFVSGSSSLGGDDENFSAMGLGFEFARSSTLGVDRRFYLGAGVGAKRLFPLGGDTDNDAALVLPTLRLSVGLLF